MMKLNFWIITISCSIIFGFMSCNNDKKSKSTKVNSTLAKGDCEKIPSAGINYIEANQKTNDFYGIKNFKSKNGVIVKYNQAEIKWDIISGEGFKFIVVGKDNILYGIKDNEKHSGVIYKYVKGKKWKLIGGKDLITLSVNAFGDILAVKKGNKNKESIRKYSPTTKKWNVLATGDVSMAEYSGNDIYVLRNSSNKTGVISKLVNGKWENLPKSGFYSFEIQGNEIFGIKEVKSKKEVYKFEKGKWTNVNATKNVYQYSRGLQQSFSLIKNPKGKITIMACS